MNFDLVVCLVVLADIIALALIVSAMIAHTLDAWRPSTRSFAVVIAAAIFIPQFAMGEPFATDSFIGLCVALLLAASIIAVVAFSLIGFVDYQHEHAKDGASTQPLNLSKLTPVK